MNILYDTSVLIAGFVTSHSQHKIALRWLEKVVKKKVTMIVSAHSLAECYAVLTRLPISPKISPNTAHQIITENIVKYGKIVSLNAKQYLSIILNASKLGLSGGIIYDDIILKTAKIAKAEKLLTLNSKDFIRLCPENEEFIILPSAI